jgi:hypothetical protein
MPTDSVQTLLEDICLVSEERYAVVETVRALVKKSFKPFAEEVKYGGILFASGVQFCGVFAYKGHVSVEFSQGARIDDVYGHLEGSGKGRQGPQTGIGRGHHKQGAGAIPAAGAPGLPGLKLTQHAQTTKKPAKAGFLLGSQSLRLVWLGGGGPSPARPGRRAAWRRFQVRARGRPRPHRTGARCSGCPCSRCWQVGSK